MIQEETLLDLEVLRPQVDSGAVDTVLLALTDMQGRLQGKELDARHFLDDVLHYGIEACGYLLAVDVEMNTVDGYTIASWDQGYGDLRLVPDLATLRRVPWHERTVLVMADAVHPGGAFVSVAPRQVLRRQLDRLAERGWRAMVGTELEFVLFWDSYEAAWEKAYSNLKPASQYNIDYSLLGAARVKPVLRHIRTAMAAAGMVPEAAKGECNHGQHEITFRFGEALATCDNHVFYKNGAKEIAAQHDMALTFMAKLNSNEGNSCHVHLSLRTAEGDPVLAQQEGGEREVSGFSRTMEHFIAGQLACIREFMPFYAPNVNSYKRYRAGSFAPTNVSWGRDNRTCAMRVVGAGPSLRVENRVPGADANPYLTVAAMIAAGLYGIENELPLPSACRTNAYEQPAPLLPTSLRDAGDLWARSDVARAAFGVDVVEHYANMVAVELAAFDDAITDWELRRGFERL